MLISPHRFTGILNIGAGAVANIKPTNRGLFVYTDLLQEELGKTDGRKV